MRSRTRRIRRQQRNHGRQTGARCFLLRRYRVLWNVISGAGIRRRWLPLGAEEGYERIFSSLAGDWYLIEKRKEARE